MWENVYCTKPRNEQFFVFWFFLQFPLYHQFKSKMRNLTHIWIESYYDFPWLSVS